MGGRADSLRASPTAPWLDALATGGCQLRIHVQPGASRNELVGRHGDALKLRIAAPAVEGAANAALIEYLAKKLNLSRREVTIAQGGNSRRKIVRVPLDPANVERCLEMRAQES